MSNDKVLWQYGFAKIHYKNVISVQSAGSDVLHLVLLVRRSGVLFVHSRTLNSQQFFSTNSQHFLELTAKWRLRGKIHGRFTKKIDSVRPHYEAAFLNPFFIHSTFLREQKKKILSTENKLSWHRFAKLWQYDSPFIHTHKVSNLGLFRSTQNVHPGRIWGTKTGVHSL